MNSAAMMDTSQASSAMASKEGSKSPTPGLVKSPSDILNRGHSTISNDFDSGIEGMDVDVEPSSQGATEKSEKRKRTSSRYV